MATPSSPKPDRESGGTQARLRRDLDVAEAAILKILETAPKATTKYKDTARAGRAVVEALTFALRDYAEAEGRWLRFKREHSHGGR